MPLQPFCIQIFLLIHSVDFLKSILNFKCVLLEIVILLLLHFSVWWAVLQSLLFSKNDSSMAPRPVRSACNRDS
jgi:hypothetical protein